MKSIISFIFYIIAIFIVKSSIWLIKFFKLGSGTNLPGKIARKIYPETLSKLVKQTRKEIITVSGTNGKTTTAGLIASIFETQQRKVVHNKRGANMLTGVTSAVAEKSSLNGSLDCDNCILEMDEAYLDPAFEEFNPDLVILTNLFRDQLDRYGELNATAQKMESAVIKSSKIKPMKLLLNADDPLVSGIGNDPCSDSLKRVFYGFDEVEYVNQREKSFSPQETVNCKCGKTLEYEKLFYGHLGYYYCSCGVKRNTAKTRANALVNVNSSVITIKSENQGEFKINVNLPGLYNCYNVLSAAAIALETGIAKEKIIKGIESYSTTFGRAEFLKLKGKNTLIQLIKNPIGATEVISAIKNDNKGKLFIIINDNYADGRDVSWLWDANFEMLADYNNTAVVSGIRAEDMAVRLKYAGIKENNILIEKNIKKAMNTALDSVENDEILYILPTYTALLEIDKIKQLL